MPPNRVLNSYIVIEFRAYLDIEVKEIADHLNVTPQEYADIERGLTKPTPNQLDQIAEMFGCRIEDIVKSNDFS